MKKGDTSPAQLHFAVLATDVALFTVKDGALLVRLVRVNRPPHFPNSMGLPGGLIDPKEIAEDAASRHIKAKAVLKPDTVYMEQLYTFSEVERDPRGRVIAVAYLALVPWEKLSAAEQQDTEEAWWSPVHNAKKLAYDHDTILNAAIHRLRSRIRYTTLINKLMAHEFTLTELEHAYESILKVTLDKRNFRKKIAKLNILKELPHKKTGGRFRPAQLYTFNSSKVLEIESL